MAIDGTANFARVTVSLGYDNAATSIVLTGGDGAKLPATPFNATWWNATDYADPTDDPNREIVRVTVISTDTLTITRAQESTSASTKNTGSKTYRLIAGLTAKMVTDLTALLLPMTDVTGTSVTMVANNAYMAHNAAQVVAALPAAAAVGDRLAIIGAGAGGWKISQTSGQQIHIGSVDTTSGASGSLSSGYRYDCLKLTCIVANNEWVVTESQAGNLQVV